MDPIESKLTGFLAAWATRARRRRPAAATPTAPPQRRLPDADHHDPPAVEPVPEREDHRFRHSWSRDAHQGPQPVITPAVSGRAR
ncbi:MAG: hypothetical protein WKF57_20285 [Nakamurella sp.]